MNPTSNIYISNHISDNEVIPTFQCCRIILPPITHSITSIPHLWVDYLWSFSIPTHHYTHTAFLSSPHLLHSPVRTRAEPSHTSHPHSSPAHVYPRPEHTPDRVLCSQISIPMDQIDEEGTCQLGVTSHQFPYSQRSSMASSMSSVPTNEGEVAYNLYRPDSFQTHSRNVSETPSIPPYHCSSSSSAYHSRNSSLGSQFSSSCFEGDSVLADIDSCMTTHSGSHGDLKYPIRLQDSRITRLSESSAMSYTSEWSLRHHVNRPIGLSEQSPNFEDTLQNMDSFQDRQKLASLKTSEWIKRQLRACRETLVQVKVSSKNKHVVHFNVRAGDVIVWEFATKKKDIAFGEFVCLSVRSVGCMYCRLLKPPNKGPKGTEPYYYVQVVER